MRNVQVGVRIPPHIHEQLAQRAANTHSSKSEIIISALAHYLGCTSDVPLSQRVAQLEAQMKELTALVKSSSGAGEVRASED